MVKNSDMSSEVDLLEIQKVVSDVQKSKDNEYLLNLRDNDSNETSLWLNLISFFIPIIGVFLVFFYLYKSPVRAKGILRVTLISLLIQSIFFILSYLFLFTLIGDLCIMLFG